MSHSNKIKSVMYQAYSGTTGCQNLLQIGECSIPLLWFVQRRLQLACVVQSKPVKVSEHKPEDQSGAETKMFPYLIHQTPKRNKEKFKSQSEQDLETGSEKEGGDLGTYIG